MVFLKVRLPRNIQSIMLQNWQGYDYDILSKIGEMQ